MFAKRGEPEFFLSHLRKKHKVLEYGSGESTLEISNRVSEVVSIEHDHTWYKKLLEKKPDNVTLLFKQPSMGYIEGLNDGTYDQFKHYITAPLEYAPFDIILIDGRARVECAKLCKELGHEETNVFIHDFHREEYKEANKYLKQTGGVGTMARFDIIF